MDQPVPEIVAVRPMKNGDYLVRRLADELVGRTVLGFEPALATAEGSQVLRMRTSGQREWDIVPEPMRAERGLRLRFTMRPERARLRLVQRGDGPRFFRDLNNLTVGRMILSCDPYKPWRENYTCTVFALSPTLQVAFSPRPTAPEVSALSGVRLVVEVAIAGHGGPDMLEIPGLGLREN